MSDVSGRKLLWILPDLGQGASGGLQTIFRHITYLQERGARCDVSMIAEQTAAEYDLRKRIRTYYDCVDMGIVDVTMIDGSDYDLCIATMNTTIPHALATGCPRVAYFVQDYEPLFYPMGDAYISAAATYSCGAIPITIGRWLAAKLAAEHGVQSYVTSFGADLTLYRPLRQPGGDEMRKERAICAIWQPEKPRRCSRLVESALLAFHELCPDVKIYLYGSKTRSDRLEGIAEHLGVLTKKECNELYNRCLVGLSMGSSNPSRIPFEMMSAGLPVVDLYQENNWYDLPAGPVCLAKPTPDALACALSRIVLNRDLQADLSRRAVSFMADRPMSLETEEFANAVCGICLGEQLTIHADDHRRMYDDGPVDADERAREVWSRLQREELQGASRPLNGRYVRIAVSSVVEASEWKAYVWHDEHQRDMQCYVLHPSSGGANQYEAVFDINEHDSFSGKYFIHVYANIDGADCMAATLDQLIAHPQRELIAREKAEKAETADTAAAKPSSTAPVFPFAVVELDVSTSAPKDVSDTDEAHREQAPRERRRGLFKRFMRG